MAHEPDLVGDDTQGVDSATFRSVWILNRERMELVYLVILLTSGKAATQRIAITQNAAPPSDA
jgi:hypothetical protein